MNVSVSSYELMNKPSNQSKVNTTCLIREITPIGQDGRHEEALVEGEQ